LLSTYAHIGPSFQAENPISNQIARFHDIYLATIQTCLYRAGPPFGSFHTRKEALAEYSKQLHVIANFIDESGPYLCGSSVTLADATVGKLLFFTTDTSLEWNLLLTD
jgi:glutathione S-transferase